MHARPRSVRWGECLRLGPLLQRTHLDAGLQRGGALVAHSRAAASSAASITQKPPTYDGASTNGSSSTRVSPEVTSTVFAVEGG